MRGATVVMPVASRSFCDIYPTMLVILLSCEGAPDGGTRWLEQSWRRPRAGGDDNDRMARSSM